MCIILSNFENQEVIMKTMTKVLHKQSIKDIVKIQK